MKQLRLIPLVVVAAFGLLLMKAVELWVTGSTIVGAPVTVAKQEDHRTNLLKNWDISLLTDNGVDPVATASEANHETPAQAAPVPEAPAAAPPALRRDDESKLVVSDKRPEEAKPIDDNQTSTQARLLQLLGERRKQVEEREKEMDVREGLLKATEMKVEKRIDDLKTIETSISTGAKTQEVEKTKELQDLVQMYESMKAKDAARVFDRLDQSLLVDIARQMNPRKLGDVVAKMQPDTAEKLTVGLANRRAKVEAPQAPSALPKIVGHDS
ncbi:MAG: hypothetical protein P4L82_03230 [Ancalomicrobiaceae bacterium]|nr:hypothetical protein [Ancalomicrobiaceae bacterium]